jgi:hypothetical protein
MNNHEAVFDTLFIGRKLQQKMKDFSTYEIDFLAYFSCLLSLYDGNTVDKWHYTFIKADLGSPFSLDVQKAIATLKGNSYIKESDESKDYFYITENGLHFLDFLENNISLLSWRTKYLKTACDSLSLIPYGTIKEAIYNEPVLTSAGHSLVKRDLLQETNPATKVLYSQFKDLKIALEDKYPELIVPAIVWLEALSSNQSPPLEV